MTTIERYFSQVCKCKVVQLFESVDEIIKCDHSNESYWAVLSCGTVHYAVQGGSNFRVCEWNPEAWLIQVKATEQYFPVILFIMLYEVVLTIESNKSHIKLFLRVSGDRDRVVSLGFWRAFKSWDGIPGCWTTCKHVGPLRNKASVIKREGKFYFSGMWTTLETEDDVVCAIKTKTRGWQIEREKPRDGQTLDIPFISYLVWTETVGNLGTKLWFPIQC